MRNPILFYRKWILVIPIFLFFLQNTAPAASELEQIREAIKTKGARWTAEENRFTKLTREEKRRLCGAIIDPATLAKADLLSIPWVENLPEVFDWRDNNGNWLTPIKDQGDCGSCWDFSAVAQVEAWWKIDNAQPDSNIDLSEQFVLSCSDGSCDGWYFHMALEFIRSTGIPTESCFAYQADDQIPCSNACANWEDERVTIPGWGCITMDEAVIENLKSAVYQHPLTAYMLVYEDLVAYSEGVYQHVYGNELGGHGVLIVGWNDEEECWICKNSWSDLWGEEGYFRIKWGDSDIGIFSVLIWDELTGGPALVVTPTKIDLELTLGDSLSQNITISNQGTEVLEFSSTHLESVVKPQFHSSSFNAWDGVSWWCGDPEIGGYNDSWLQYLELPVLDLSNTDNPSLSWMGFWATEDHPPTLDIDGYDGCNVWISIDNGNTFNLAFPQSPAYNCQKLFSFEYPFYFKMVPGIAGWGKSSDGWIPVEFDLSSYKSDSVVVRFAFASDGGYCTIGNPSWSGFFVDDIIVSDGGEVIFENHGEDTPAIAKIGYCNMKGTDWLDVAGGAGAIQPGDSISIEITVRTRELEPDNYHSIVYFSSNDTTVSLEQFSLDLEVMAPDHDVAVKQLWLPGENIPLLFPVIPGALIKNYGLNDETDFDLVCTATIEGEPYHDTTHISSIMAGESEVVKFKQIHAVSDTGSLDFLISMININFPDYNSYNNSLHAQADISNLVDGFETETGFWAFEGGWGITNNLSAYSGTHVANVNGDEITYLNNMNTTMTFTPGFNLQLTDEATLKFYTRYDTELDKDICYVELSGDSINWIKADSISGSSNWRWKEYSIDLKNTGFVKAWVRFYFISDNQNTGSGVRIDNVGIYKESVSNIIAINPNAIPKEYRLAQNYPNPFNPATKISYSLAKSGLVRLKIYNILGQEIQTLVNKFQKVGEYTISFDAENLASGIYFYKLQVGDNCIATKKMILMR
jgi:C1A family cysteine protease